MSILKLKKWNVHLSRIDDNLDVDNAYGIKCGDMRNNLKNASNRIILNYFLHWFELHLLLAKSYPFSFFFSSSLSISTQKEFPNASILSFGIKPTKKTLASSGWC